MVRLSSWRGKSLALVLWGLALLLPQAARGPVAAHLWPARLPGHVRVRATRPGMGSAQAARTELDEQAVLGHARATAFGVGTNLRGQSGGAAWAFLLPSLELGLVLCVGAPSAAALRTLGHLADEVVVPCDGGRERWILRRRCDRAGITNAHAVGPSELPARPADLAIVSGGRAAAAVASDARLTAALRGARAAFFEPAGRETGVSVIARALPHGGTTVQLAPAAGEAHTAAAEGDMTTIAYLERSAAAGSFERDGRRAVLRAPGITAGALRAPAYVQEIAGAYGLAIGEHRLGLAAPFDYASRKPVMFLFPAGELEPELIVKLARDARQNARLENEWRALKWLSDAGVAGALPRPAFFGHHAGLAVLGESAVPGAPFHSRTNARYDCPLARAALEWLLALGVATAHPAAGDGDVAAALGDLASRFKALYRLTSAQRAGLERQIDALASLPLPLVLQHGDPGAWNLLVGAEGAPAFLDWEAAERHGMPLWDAFYFVRSFAVTVARARGKTTSLGAVRRELLADRPLSRLLASAVERHCAQIGLDTALVEPLLITCWMHRALKEATRRPSGRLDSGHYVNLLRLCLDRADAPGLRRLYGLS